jgi:hypothetical protein
MEGNIPLKERSEVYQNFAFDKDLIFISETEEMF